MHKHTQFTLLFLALLLLSGAPRLSAEIGSDASSDVHYLKAATAFADCMIAHGRDRYGEVHSPLFSNLLLREKEPKIGPYPLFPKSPYNTQNMNTPFKKFDFNKVLNYPAGLGAEGPHKVTFYGCDPYEDRELYQTLFELTRITGDPQYRAEAEKALIWWFKNTQGPAGLFPWGEHLGWDFQYDRPTYFAGPSKHLYAACYHEVKDDVPFLDILARLPAEKPGGRTPLERYALAIWRAHFWDRDKAYYCRHGDYTGNDDRHGSPAGFPAHLGAYLRIWAAAYLHSRDDAFKKEIRQVFDKVHEMAVSRTEKYGFFPFTFDPELKGKHPGKSTPGQSIRLAHHALDVARLLKKELPGVAAQLDKLALLHLGEQKFAEAVRAGSPNPAPSIPKAPPRLRDLSSNNDSNAHATEIIKYIELHRQTGDAAFLQAAQTHARLAYALFMDDKCPLPKAHAGSAAHRTTQGEPFPDYYFRGARLMRAFALLGEAQRPAASRRNQP